MAKFVVIDGNSLVHRAFHALPLLSNRQGVFTNAVLGFTTMLFKILKNEEPDYIAVAFDKGRAFRHDEYEDYKKHRKPTPEELRPQFQLVKQILEALNVKIFDSEGYEGDDIIGTLVRRAEESNMESLVLTGDRDMLQLVSPQTSVMLTKKGISEIDTYDLNTLKDKYKIEPERLIDVKALKGDISDNIPGVPGIGEKTALNLVREFGSIEKILENLDKLPSKKTAEKIEEHREQLVMSRSLVTISQDVEIAVDLDNCEYVVPDYNALLKIFDELEFKKLAKEIRGKIKSDNYAEENNQENNFVVITSNNAGEYLKDLGKEAAVFPLFNSDEIYCLGVTDSKRILVLRLDNEVGNERYFDLLKLLFERKDTDFIFYDSKCLFKTFLKAGIDFNSAAEDLFLTAYLLNPSASGYELQDLAMEHLDRTVIEPKEPEFSAALYSSIVYELKDILLAKLELAELSSLYYELELPLVKVLAKMELNGFSVDKEQLNEMAGELSEKIEETRKRIYDLAGEEFNINSPKQLSVILFEKLDLPVIKRTKTGYSTSAEVLEELAQYHKIADELLYYRQLTKLKSTYVDGLYKLINKETGKIHTTFNQTITATGRLSSTEPNLQNIPVRLELGRKIRKVFVSGHKDWTILAADYSQIELRVLAYLSGDENLRDAFNRNEDIHTRTASEVFGVALEDVDRNMRRMAKAVNFGIVYGISDFGLARDLGISREEARKYITKYFERYPKVKEYMDRVIACGREKGYVTTILNRRRYLPDLLSSNRNTRSFGERTAMNTPIQGSAADIIKLAMLNADKEIEESKLNAKMILQVHDELIFEVKKDELEKAARSVKKAMEKAYILEEVSLVVDLKYGENWFDMQSIDIDEE